MWLALGSVKGCMISFVSRVLSSLLLYVINSHQYSPVNFFVCCLFFVLLLLLCVCVCVNKFSCLALYYIQAYYEHVCHAFLAPL